MQACPSCRERVKDDALRCKHCGADLNVKKCPWCAELIDSAAQKCKHCKSYLAKVRCKGCENEVELEEMRCELCTKRKIEAEVMESFQQERARAKLRSWFLLLIIFLLVGVLLAGALG